ncbi:MULTISPECIES: MarR family transcriptional regulator [unclassified Nocardia]|uniref:MarR family winged helix-turn-helix transcriptional regulator n=1 Tax=unclassified Nocardia TaxID=2637762 RepID=UPI0024A7F242|nr:MULTISPECIES: MarR family transcriptional regulator [unclassified Nocardia]
MSASPAPGVHAPSADIPEALIDDVARQLIRLHRLRDRTNAQIAAASDGEVEPAAFAILFQLICAGPMRSGALAETLYSDASTVSRQVANLVKRGFLERRADPTDGRVSVLSVTDAGHAAAAEIRARRNQSLRLMLADWTSADRETFAALLRRFVDDYETTRSALLTSLYPNSQAAERHP